MNFLDAFQDDAQQRLLDIAARIELEPGQYLMRRGDPGGDLYVLDEGALEVVDTRAQPEVVLRLVEPGAIIGELSFVDQATRTADVRVRVPSKVLHWPREDLHALLARETAFAASFYRHLSEAATRRARHARRGLRAAPVVDVTAAAMAMVEPQRAARKVAEPIKERLRQVEIWLRQDAEHPAVPAHLALTLSALEERVRELLEPLTVVEARQTALVLARELHPYFARAKVADACLHRAPGGLGTSRLLEAVHANTPTGDGPLGTRLDAWLLERPTLVALRELHQPTVALARAHCEAWGAAHSNRRALVISAGAGAMVSKLAEALHGLPTTLTVLDESREALAYVKQTTEGTSAVTFQTRRQDLGRLSLGRLRRPLEPQDLIVVHELLEYLPDRLLLTLFGTLKGLLAPGGAVVLAVPTPSEDAALFDHFLNWPMVRRPADHLIRLVQNAGLWPRHTEALSAPGLALLAEGPRSTEAEPAPALTD